MKENDNLIEERARDILDNYYEDLRAFFENVFQRKYDFKIIVSRRCFVLFKLFSTLLSVNTNENGTYITEQAIPFYKDELKDKTCLIVDDILIHGRTLLSIYNALNDCKNKDIYVFMKDLEPYNYLDRKGIKYESSQKGYANVWRALSNQFVKLILSLNIPYLSYIIPYKATLQENEYRQLREKTAKNSFSLSTLAHYNLHDFNEETAFLYIPSMNSENKSLFEQLCDFTGIRFYYNPERSQITIVPYVILKPVKADKLDALFQLFSLPEPLKEKLFCSQNENPNLEKAKLNLITCLLSKYYGECVIKSVCGEYTRNGAYQYEYVANSYFKDFAAIAPGIQRNDTVTAEQVADCVLDCDEACADFSDDLYHTVLSKSNIQDKEDGFERIQLYLQFCGDSEEQKFKENFKKNSSEPEECRGIGLNHLISKLYPNTEKNDVYAQLLKAADTGLGSLYIQKTKTESNREMLCTFIKPGEQAYRSLLELYGKTNFDLLNCIQTMSYYYEAITLEQYFDFLKTNKSQFPLISKILDCQEYLLKFLKSDMNYIKNMLVENVTQSPEIENNAFEQQKTDCLNAFKKSIFKKEQRSDFYEYNDSHRVFKPNHDSTSL